MLCQGAHPTLFLSDVVMVMVWTSLEGKPASLTFGKFEWSEECSQLERTGRRGNT